MIDRKPVPIFWERTYTGMTLKNFDILKDCLANGYKVVRVDRLDDKTLMYIISSDFDDEGINDD